VLERHLGPARHFNGRNAKAALLLRTGASTDEAPAGSRGVARDEGLSARDQRELSRLEAQIRTYIDEGRLRLDPRGQAALDAGDLPNLARVQGGSADPSVLFDSRQLDGMIQQHFLVLNQPWKARFERYAELQRDHDRKTVALFVEPLPRGGP